MAFSLPENRGKRLDESLEPQSVADETCGGIDGGLCDRAGR